MCLFKMNKMPKTKSREIDIINHNKSAKMGYTVYNLCIYHDQMIITCSYINTVKQISTTYEHKKIV